jgi:hypothetical protein
LAIPEDFSKLQELQKILRFVNLLIGVLVVHKDGRIETLKEAGSKETEFSISRLP